MIQLQHRSGSFLNIRLQSKNSLDAEAVLHSSVKSVTMETTSAMLESHSYNYVNTNSEGTLHFQSLPIKCCFNTIRIYVPVIGVGCVYSFKFHHIYYSSEGDPFFFFFFGISISLHFMHYLKGLKFLVTSLQCVKLEKKCRYYVKSLDKNPL